MLAFRVRYLLGRVAAADFSRGADKDRGEWPLHPDRLFCALVQAWGDLGRPQRGRELLERLERSASPPLVHSARASADIPRVGFVPVPDNWKPFYRDANTKKDKPFPVMGALRVGRDRKERRFISRALELDGDLPHATIGWPRHDWNAQDFETAAVLARLVGYVGHSSSVVAVDVANEMPAPTWRPDERGTFLLRVPAPDRLKMLEHAFDAGRRPPAASWLPYGEGHTPPAGLRTPWRDMVVLRLAAGPHRLPLVAALRVTRRSREQLGDIFRDLHGQDAPEVLTGRSPHPAGDSTRSPHLAFVPLADVGHRHAAGHLMGLAILLPHTLVGDERRRVLAAIARLTDLDLARIGHWQLERQTLETSVHGLLPETWNGPSMTWTTVTPMAFDRDPGDLLGSEASAGVALACARVGLPEPDNIALSSVPFLLGAVSAREFPLFRAAPATQRRRHVHVRLHFGEPVHGPVAIGAGRYLGYGFCRPIEESIE